MKSYKKEKLPIKSNEQKVQVTNDELRCKIAIGTITLFISTLVLIIINSAIYYNYHPDITAILEKVIPLSIYSPNNFLPEPVERLQFQISLICIPFIIFFIFTLINKKRNFFYTNPLYCLTINITGLATLFLFISIVFSQDLVNVPNQTTKYFFKNNLIGIFNPFLVFIGYAIFVYLFYRYNSYKETILRKNIIAVITYVIVAVIILDVVLYNVLHLAKTGINMTAEINSVLYVITQVYAGKSLLVDTNCMYGLYAWLLLPLFWLIGISTYKITLVLAILNGISYLLFFLGIKKIIKKDILSVIIFMCLIFWQYWSQRIPEEVTEPRQYYQYCPIRIFFPSLVFFLIATYNTSSERLKKILLPVLTLSASFAILWNLDSGFVTYGAAMVFLLASAINSATTSETIKRSLFYIAWMLGSLCFVLLLFFISTKLHSGQWPDFKKFFEYQTLYYISGFFMLPMGSIHFWNITVIVYLITCIYCFFNLRKTQDQDMPVLAFLFILGAGTFAYFQGRSYDLSLEAVMYPQIIILGIFCSRLIVSIQSNQYKFHESVIIFLIVFMFLADGAFSMLYHIPAIHSYAYDNATTTDEQKETQLANKINFIESNIPKKDTVLIISKTYEGFYYAEGEYYNPLNLPGSTEYFFKSEIYTVLDLIRTTKYPIIVDAALSWAYSDTILKTLAEYTIIKKELKGQNLLLLTPDKKQIPDRLINDANTLYYNCYGGFSKYIKPVSIPYLSDSFTIEMYVKLDTEQLIANNVMFCNFPQQVRFTGLLMMQDGNDLTSYKFAYGNGMEWCKGSALKLSCTHEDHVIIKVRNNIITIFNNGILCGTSNTNSSIKPNDGAFLINPSFAGTVSGLKISTE